MDSEIECSIAFQDLSCSVPMTGWEFTNDANFKQYLASRVKGRLMDIEGIEELTSYYEAIDSTGFTNDRLKEIFSISFDFEPWRIGEALGECFLEDKYDLKFPWNGCRDMKVKHASPPGADLVGFKKRNGTFIFVFGEVKTSNDTNSPPNVMYGRAGMTKQLENLKDAEPLRNTLVTWLAWRAKGQSWEELFKTALKSYISNSEYVFLQGVLIRDTPANLKDVKSRGLVLGEKKPPRMEIALLGIYCPCKLEEFPRLIAGMVGS